jgi:hypothetical protein
MTNINLLHRGAILRASPRCRNKPEINICQELYFIKCIFYVTFNSLPKFKFTFADEVLGFSCLHDCNGVETEYGRFCWQKLANTLSEGRYCGSCYNNRKGQNFGASLFTNMLIHPSLSVVTRVRPFSRVQFDTLSFIFVLLKGNFALGYFVVIISLFSH